MTTTESDQSKVNRDGKNKQKTEAGEEAQEPSLQENTKEETTTGEGTQESAESVGTMQPSIGESKRTSNEIEKDEEGDKKESDDDSKKDKKRTDPPKKKAKIAMPPAVSALQLDVEKYALDQPPASDANQDKTKISTPALMVFGLHPLVKEKPFKKLCEDFGTPIQSFGVRSAFASRYCHLEYSTVDQAQAAYVALNGAKLFQKALLVQPAPVSRT